MKNFGLACLDEFLGGRVVYRNLQAADPELPRLDWILARAGMPGGSLPRKSENGYAVVILHLLQEAQRRRSEAVPLKRLLYVGDTRLLDGSAFSNLCRVSGWPGLAFIGSETAEPARVEIAPAEGGGRLYLTNRWPALETFSTWVLEQGFAIDEATAVVVDLDKTALGARGRNGHVIDEARLQAVEDTVAALLGTVYQPERFRQAYDRLNQPEFHPFTADNQDYLAYTCLVLEAGLYRLDELIQQIRAGRLVSFAQLIQEVDRRRRELPAELERIHTQIYTCVQGGDPTPFKAFRRNEYLSTIGRFGCLEDTTSLLKLLSGEILITQEVRVAALGWQKQGALLFGLSDKPDEAALPTPELAQRGYLPLHQACTHAVGC